MHHLERAYKGNLSRVHGHQNILPTDMARKSEANTLRDSPLPDFKHEVPNKMGMKHIHDKYGTRRSSRR